MVQLIYLKIWFLPKRGWAMLQFCTSTVNSLLQGLPPKVRGGWEQVLERNWFPSPQVTEQEDQGPQSLHMASEDQSFELQSHSSKCWTNNTSFSIY